jgi:hypothetical protein
LPLNDNSRADPNAPAEGTASLRDSTDMFDAASVFFKAGSRAKSETTKIEAESRLHAEMVHELVTDGMRGEILLPANESELRELAQDYALRKKDLGEKFDQLARSRTADEEKILEIVGLLFRWIAVGTDKN